MDDTRNDMILVLEEITKQESRMALFMNRLRRCWPWAIKGHTVSNSVYQSTLADLERSREQNELFRDSIAMLKTAVDQNTRKINSLMTLNEQNKRYIADMLDQYKRSYDERMAADQLHQMINGQMAHVIGTLAVIEKRCKPARTAAVKKTPRKKR